MLVAGIDNGAEHCARIGKKAPSFRHEQVKPGAYSVTLIIEKDKFSLPKLFGSEGEGREVIARKVLNRERDLVAKKGRIDV